MGDQKRRILVHGHRGARARRPENTLPAFEYSIGAGADFLELDVVVTKDNVAVVTHDPQINEILCEGPKPGTAIYELTLEELREYDCGAKKNSRFPDQQPVPGARIPTLDEVFRLGEGNAVGFNVEVKIFADRPELTPAPEPFARIVLDAIRRHRLQPRVLLQSFDARITRAMRSLDPEIPRGALFEESRDWMDAAREFEASFLAPEYSLVTAEKVAQAHDAGLQVIPWTVNGPSDWQRLTDAGVDAIITDDPAALIAWFRDRGVC